MPIKTVLYVCAADTPDSDIKMAASMCEAAEAHLSLLVVGISLNPPLGEAVSLSETWLEERDSELKAIAARADSARSLLEAYQVSRDVDQQYGEAVWLADEIGMRAQYSDLVMLGHPVLHNGAVSPPVLEGLIFHSPRPLLLVPEGAMPTLAPRNVLVAWDSRKEAARAVHYAVDLLRQADRVSIVMVDPVARRSRSGEEPGADLAAYLARHGAKVVVERLASEGRSIAQVLTQHAADTAADMIVMGAYGHSRLRERLFGGVTRSFLKKCPVPILMAH